MAELRHRQLIKSQLRRGNHLEPDAAAEADGVGQRQCESDEEREQELPRNQKFCFNQDMSALQRICDTCCQTSGPTTVVDRNVSLAPCPAWTSALSNLHARHN